MQKLYTLTGITGVAGSAGGSLALALSPDFIVYSLFLWFIGVLSFTVHFSLIRLKKTLHLEYTYHVINTIATYNYTASVAWTALYASLGVVVYVMTQLMLRSDVWRHRLPKQDMGELPKAISNTEILAIILSLSGAALMATKLVPLEYVFILWMAASLAYISMSIMLGTYHVLWNGLLYLVADIIGIANHGPEIFGLSMTVFIIAMFFVITMSIRFNQRHYGKSFGV